MHRHILHLVALSLVLAIASAALAGWGRVALRWLGIDALRRFPCAGIWLGIIVAIIFAETVQLVAPINWVASAVFCLCGLIFFLLSERSRDRPSRQPAPAFLPYIVGTTFLIALIWASISMVPSRHYDLELYYEPTVSWLSELSISFGIANLHSRFGFNQSYFPFAALLNAHPLWNHGLITANLLISLVTGATVLGLCRPLHRDGAILLVILSLVFADLLYTPVNPSPDATIGLIEIVIFLVLFRMFYKPQTEAREEDAALCVMLVLLCALGLTIKLSSAVFVVTSLLIAAAKLATVQKAPEVSVAKVAIICAVLVGMSFLRGYVISGYPLYPSTLGGLQGASWALPVEMVRAEVEWIFSWARAPGGNPADILASWGWIARWAEAFPLKGKLIFSAIAVLFLVGLLIPRPVGNQARRLPEVAVIYVPLLAAVLFLFFTAPDLRFLGTVAELLLVLATWILYYRISMTPVWMRIGRHVEAFAIVVALALSVLFFVDFRLIPKTLEFFDIGALYPTATAQEIGWRIEGSTWRIVNLTLIFLIFTVFRSPLQATPYGKYLVNLGALVLSIALVSQMTLVMGFFVNDQQGWRAKPQKAHHEFKTNTGLVIHVPASGDQCGNIQFPCAPAGNPNLHTVENFMPKSMPDFGYPNLGVK